MNNQGFFLQYQGLVWFYLWIHVKIYFDQLSKAGKRVQVAPIKQSIQNGGPAPINVTVLAPYPHYDKNHSVFDGGNYGPPNYEIKPNQINPVFPKPPPTPLVQPPTPMPPKQLDDIDNKF